MPSKRVKVQWDATGHAREVVVAKMTAEGDLDLEQRVQWDEAGRPRTVVMSHPSDEAAATVAAIDEEDADGYTVLKIKIPKVRGRDGDTDPLVRAAGVSDAIENLEGEVTALVRRARAQGYTWTQIGDALGTSKQAAWERFSEED
jgi:hypothetical protein